MWLITGKNRPNCYCMTKLFIFNHICTFFVLEYVDQLSNVPKKNTVILHSQEHGENV